MTREDKTSGVWGGENRSDEKRVETGAKCHNRQKLMEG